MNSKYIDISSIVQLIGNIYNNPCLLEKDDKYHFTEKDFVNEFHQIVFASLYNLYQLGAKTLSIQAVESYLSTRPKAEAIYKANKGAEYILKCSEIADINQFDYYYNKLKKMSLLRAYNDLGLNLDWLYDPDSLDIKELQQQSDKLDNMSLEEISNLINNKIDSIKTEYVAGVSNDTCGLGEGVFDMLNQLQESPDVGVPLYGPFINTVTRGARLGRFYLRSAATNVGKTRAMVGDCCYLGCSQMYNLKTNKWESIGACQPTLFIATEQSIEEIQKMALAFISGVEENHISLNEYYTGEYERVQKAAQLLVSSKIRFIEMPDFSLQDIENIIKSNIRENGVQYIFLDYIHTSLGILSEISQRSGGVKLREDNVLFMLSVKLKDICTQYGVFILSSTQLNQDWKTAELPDQNLLRGAKSIADKVDFGAILMDATKDDIEKIRPFCIKNNLPIPNVKMSIYKNRANEHKGEYLWMIANRGICRFETLFITDWNYGLKENVPDIKIKVVDESVF